jgi:hypothetical protein
MARKISKLQKKVQKGTGKVGYYLNIPKEVVEASFWKKGDEIVFQKETPSSQDYSKVILVNKRIYPQVNSALNFISETSRKYRKIMQNLEVMKDKDRIQKAFELTEQNTQEQLLADIEEGNIDKRVVAIRRKSDGKIALVPWIRHTREDEISHCINRRRFFKSEIKELSDKLKKLRRAKFEYITSFPAIGALGQDEVVYPKNFYKNSI